MSEPVLIAIIVTIGGVVGGAISALIIGAQQRRKTTAETNDLIADSVTKLIKPLYDRICELERVIDLLKKENFNLKAWAEKLVAQIKTLGGTPVDFTEIDPPK